MKDSRKHHSDGFNPSSPAFGYVALGAAALAVMFLVLLRQGQSVMVSALILLVGGCGLAARMRLAPLLVVFLVAAGKIAVQIAVDLELGVEETQPALGVGDALLSAAILGYVACQYRLQGLDRSIVPPELDTVSEQSVRRSPALVTPGEQALLAASLPFWALAAQFLWHWLAQRRNLLEWSARATELAVCLLVLAGGMTVAAALLNYARRRRLTPDEARLLFQDTLWNETRGEQRWFTRWLAWFNKEQP